MFATATQAFTGAVSNPPPAVAGAGIAEGAVGAVALAGGQAYPALFVQASGLQAGQGVAAVQANPLVVGTSLQASQGGAALVVPTYAFQAGNRRRLKAYDAGVVNLAGVGPRYLEKRTYDAWRLDVMCTDLLLPSEQITTVLATICDQLTGPAISLAAVNIAPAVYLDGITAAVGQVVQMTLSGGTIPLGQDDIGLGVPNLMCTLRVRVQTTITPQIEATVRVLLKDALT